VVLPPVPVVQLPVVAACAAAGDLLDDGAGVGGEMGSFVEFADLARQYNVAPTSIKYVLAKSGVELGRKAGTEVKTDQQCL
jgi:hypothetical protein